MNPGLNLLWPTPLGLHRYPQAQALNPLLVRIFGALRATQLHARGEAPGAAFFTLAMMISPRLATRRL